MATAIEWPELIFKASMVKFAEPITAYLWIQRRNFPV